MKSLFEKIGHNPKRCMTLFISGVAFFALGLFFIFLGYYSHHLLQVPGLVFLSFGSFLSILGYLGIFICRMQNAVNRHKK